MAKKGKGEPSGPEKGDAVKELPGVSLERFKAAVQALVVLRDTGKVQVFLRPVGSVAILGDTTEFAEALAKELGEQLSEREARAVLDEVRNLCALSVHFQDTETTAKLLRDSLYDSEYSKLDSDEKLRFREREEEKLSLISGQLVTEAMRQRAKRIASATVPCVDDVDVELVKERRDSSRRVAAEPFLRLRLRYSDERVRGYFPFPFLFVGRFGEMIGSRASSFEIECDLTDIDMLIFQLTAAKNVLLAAREQPATESRICAEQKE